MRNDRQGARGSAAAGLPSVLLGGRDIADRLVRNGILAAFPDEPLSFSLLKAVAQQTIPTRPFGDGSTLVSCWRLAREVKWASTCASERER